MKKIKIWGEPSDAQLAEATEILKQGGLIIYPTDTLYAMACDMESKRGTERLCRAKGLEAEKSPLSLICADISMASEYTLFGNSIFRLLKSNTPGPFTFILKGTSRLPRTLRGRKELGIRIPAAPTARALASALGHPLLSASLDYSPDFAGDDPEIAAEPYANDTDLLLIENELAATPSTIVDCRGGEPEIIRAGLGRLNEQG